MYNPDTELMFPSRVIDSLRSLRGESWRDLVDRVAAQEQNSLDHLAFVLMMVRMGGCLSCNADSFRAMRGCTQCARQTVRRFRGSDQELLSQFQQALQEVTAFMQKKSNGSNQAR